MSDILKGDKTWVYHKNVGRKISNASWVGEGQPPKTIIRAEGYKPKTVYILFIRSDGMVHVCVVLQADTIDSYYYIEIGISPEFKTIEKKGV